uniref:Methyltransferase domain-containing protein n=1 Tax=Capra hircus TaxID=9925 RepID=A0A452EZ88_CAPHI
MLQCLILGTGVFLVELAKFDFSYVTGIDYSPSAIQLSGSIIEKEGLSNVTLKVEDFLNPSTKLCGFHYLLNPDNAIEKRKQYLKSLSRQTLLKNNVKVSQSGKTEYRSL